METTEIASWIEMHLPETMLFVGGILAILIVICYVRDKDSLKYKFTMFLGLIFGVIMLYEAMTMYGEWRMVTSVIVAIAGFALVIRPFREVHFAVIFALMVMVLVYIAFGGFEGYMLFDSIDMTFLSDGWPRIIAAFLCGAVVYMVLNFAEAIVKLFGKILNWWPLLFVLGIICVVEAGFMYMGYGSIMDYIDTSAITA
ncbi:MAG: hypothetical protein A3205_06880 [Methanomassiliicoccales archaeon Mx-03]|nr:MAG: hypothetical protein A3205_06880 [Methanomassiliicoccales archaeon Mx-03]